jgi:hypothetical protein
LFLKIAQLINVITDANDAIKPQFTEDAINLLKATMANGKNPNLLRVLCASILFNLSPTEQVPALLKMTLPIINMCLDFEPQTTIIQTIQPHLKGLVSHSQNRFRLRPRTKRSENLRVINFTKIFCWASLLPFVIFNTHVLIGFIYIASPRRHSRATVPRSSSADPHAKERN